MFLCELFGNIIIKRFYCSDEATSLSAKEIFWNRVLKVFPIILRFEIITVELIAVIPYWNDKLYNLKSNFAPVNNHQTIQYFQILRSMHLLVFVVVESKQPRDF